MLNLVTKSQRIHMSADVVVIFNNSLQEQHIVHTIRRSYIQMLFYTQGHVVQELTINTINRYLELKAKQRI